MDGLACSLCMPARRVFYDQRAPYRAEECQRFYHTLLKRYFAFLIPPGSRVLEIGCGLGDLLASLEPSRGVGVDFSPETLAIARTRHPGLEFQEGDATQF